MAARGSQGGSSPPPESSDADRADRGRRWRGRDRAKGETKPQFQSQPQSQFQSQAQSQPQSQSSAAQGFDHPGSAAKTAKGESAEELERGFRDDYSEPAGDQAGQEARDPIEVANGRSLELRSILNFQYPGGRRYCSDNLAELLRRAAEFHAVEVDSRYLVRMEDVALRLLTHGSSADPIILNWQERIGSLIPAIGADSASTAGVPDIQSLIDSGAVVLRFDVVEVLAVAANDREPGESLDIEHLLIATLRSRSGQAALAKAGAMGVGIEPLAIAAADVLHHPDLPHALTPAKREAIGAELARQPLLVSLEDEVGASFDADRPRRLTLDSLGVRDDAAALSSLILLRAATPPLAVGLFGAWGSGKSTLMRELQHRIHEDLAQEAVLRRQGAADRNPDTERVGHVVQIEFNAWAYADSQNLWASLASEIFDQLAAGGLKLDRENGADRQYETLVNEVKLRSSRDAAAVRVSDHEIAALRQRIGIAEESLSAAIRDQGTAASEAAVATAYALVAPQPSKGSDTIYVRFGEPVKKKDRDAAAIVQDAIGEGASLDALLKSYAGESTDIIRFVRILVDFARKRPMAAGAILLFIFGVLLLLASARSWLPAMLGAIPTSWVSAAAAAGGLAWLWKILAPALRFAAMFNRNIGERRAAARAAEVDARDSLGKLRSELERVEAGRNASEAWIQKFGLLADGANAASPAIMLEYLMSGSADVQTLRSQLGVVATVRRCFEQLDAVLRRMRAEGSPGSLDRIILYIDDLDRCTPDQVSQVLQAVHLLLAFECFVVVVAVDARWLKQSLETSQAQLKAAKASDPTLQPMEQVATASDYLEKIFQIAFWVRPLVDQDAEGPDRYAAYRSLVRGIASPTRAALAASVLKAPPQQAPAGETAGDRFSWTDPKRLDQADAPRRRGLQLSEPEVAFMEAMGPLAAKSPRSVKRMVNLYRLLRVRYRGDQLGLFLSKGAPGVPSYRELLFALALEIGLSPISRQKIRAYVTHEAGPDWTPSKLEAQLLDAEKPLLEAVLPALGELKFDRLFAAVEEVRRFSFVA